MTTPAESVAAFVADPYCLPGKNGHIRCPHCREVAQGTMPRRETPDGQPMRDLLPGEVKRIREIAAKVFASSRETQSLLDEAFQIIGLDDFNHAMENGEWADYFYPEEDTADEFADGLLWWARTFQESFNDLDEHGNSRHSLSNDPPPHP